MTIQEARTGSVPVIPDGAPFSMEQRAWLNGFFAGLLSLDAKAGISPLTGDLPDAAAKALAGDGDDGEAPWHDAAMAIDERMQLAEGRPLKRKLFAAMAQQDCGQCGYLCETYSAAIAAELAKGAELPRAIAVAKKIVSSAIRFHFVWKSGRGKIFALNPRV